MRPKLEAGLLLLAPIAALAGCRPAARQLPIATIEPTPTKVLSSPSPKPSPTPTAVPTATTPSCLRVPGEVIEDEYIDPGLSRSIPYHLYLPPCYDLETSGPYPVVMLLHGLQLTDSQWVDLGVAEVADRLVRQGAVPPFVIVMPWERKGLDFEDALVSHLLPFIRETYAGDGDRRTTSIGGISRGAGWALRIGLKHPDTFGAIGLHSPAILVPDLYWIPGWIQDAGPHVPALWIDVAGRDTSLAGAKELAALFDKLGVDYTWTTAPGEHSAPYWSSRLEDYLRWYGGRWLER